MFIFYNNKIVNSDFISKIDCEKLFSENYLTINLKDGTEEIVIGTESINIIMRLCPAFLEGKRLKYIRNAWAIHNMVGHPLMQIFSWIGLPSLGIKIHDKSTPNPKKNNDYST